MVNAKARPFKVEVVERFGKNKGEIIGAGFQFQIIADGGFLIAHPELNAPNGQLAGDVNF